MNPAKSLGAILAAFSVSVVMVSCNSDDESDLTVAQSCHLICQKSVALGCPGDPAGGQLDCEAACMAVVAEIGFCADEAGEYYACGAKVDAADWLCDEENEANIREGSCPAELTAYKDCLMSEIPMPRTVCERHADALMAPQCPADVAATWGGRVDECLALITQYPDCGGELIVAYSCPAALQPANWQCGADGAASLAPGICPYTGRNLAECLAGGG